MKALLVIAMLHMAALLTAHSTARPAVGPLLRRALVARFCRTLGTLLEGGIALVSALGLLASASSSARMGAAAAAVEAAVEGLTSVIEPVLIVLVGIAVGGILVAMYLPMFELAGVAGPRAAAPSASQEAGGRPASACCRRMVVLTRLLQRRADGGSAGGTQRGLCTPPA